MQLVGVALSLLIATANGHTYMSNPVPFPSQLEDSGYQNKDGSNWPCKGEKEYNPDNTMDIWNRGSQQYLQAMGGASHGGGSCQVSVTEDLKPTRESVWRVIHSIHGGCPIRNEIDGNYGKSATVLLPDIYNFTIPDWLPLSRLTMAWTMYGRQSMPEMFMQCAPIMVLGGPTDKDLPDVENRRGFDTAPLMFEANNGNGCWTQNRGSCLELPDPGKSVETNTECPFDRSLMLEGTCGPEYNLSGKRRLNWLQQLFSVFKVFLRRRIKVGYGRVATFKV